MRTLLLPTLLLLIGGGGGGLAQPLPPLLHEEYDPAGTRMEVVPLVSQLPASGYLPVRIRLHNGSTVPRSWSFDFLSGSIDFTGDGNELRARHRLECPPGRSLTQDVLIPLVTAFPSRRGHTPDLKGNSWAAPLRASEGTLSTAIDPRWPSVMISATLHTPNRGPLSQEVNAYLARSTPSAHYHGGSRDLEFGASFHPELLAEDWRAYSGFDCCLMT